MMPLQPILEDDLVLLRPLEAIDFEALYQVAKDPLIWEQHPAKNRHQKSQFEKLFKEFIDSKATLVIIDQSTGEVIGSSRFKYPPKNQTAIEIGWSFLARNYWGGTYNKSVKTLMINHAFQFVETIVFYIDKTNIRSQRAVEKIGGKKADPLTFPNLIRMDENYATFIIEKEQW